MNYRDFMSYVTYCLSKNEPVTVEGLKEFKQVLNKMRRGA